MTVKKTDSTKKITLMTTILTKTMEKEEYILREVLKRIVREVKIFSKDGINYLDFYENSTQGHLRRFHSIVISNRTLFEVERRTSDSENIILILFDHLSYIFEKDFKWLEKSINLVDYR